LNKDLITIIGGRLFQVLIILLSIRILTTLLSPEEVGNYYLATTILAFFNLVLLNPTGTYFSRNLLQFKKSKNLLNALLVFLLWMIIVVVLTFPLITLLFNLTNFSTKFNFWAFVFFIISAVMISTTHRNILASINTLGYRKSFVIFLNTTLIIGLISSITLVYFYNSNSLSWLFGVIVGEALMIFSIFKIFVKGNNIDIKKIKSIFSKKRLTEILKFTLPIGITTFLMWGQSMSYRFIVDFKYSAESLGFIAVGLGISSGIFVSLETIAMQYYNPIFLKDILDANKDQRTNAWNKMASIFIPVYTLAMVFVFCMAETLTSLLVDSKFHDSFIFAMVGATIEFFRVLTNLLNNVSQSERKTSNTIMPYFIGFFIVLCFLQAFDFSKNLLMISVILSIAYFSSCIVMYVQMKKLLNISIKVNFLKILILSLPFGLIFLLPDTNLIITNLCYLILFGSYFMFCLWSLLKKLI
tara:strand:- start:278 stop:1687 length:1410 start_codon:yes stop_codon:yes gene_type:complete